MCMTENTYGSQRTTQVSQASQVLRQALYLLSHLAIP